MVEQIVQTLYKSRPCAPLNIVEQIPALARRIEATLFKNAASVAEYSDRFTLEARMKSIASSSVSRAKRQRQTPHNSSCDLVKLHQNHRKRAMIGRRESETDLAKHEAPAIVACVSINGGEKEIAFNFSKSTANYNNNNASDQGRDNECALSLSNWSDDGEMPQERHRSASCDDEDELSSNLSNEDYEEDDQDSDVMDEDGQGNFNGRRDRQVVIPGGSTSSNASSRPLVATGESRAHAQVQRTLRAIHHQIRELLQTPVEDQDRISNIVLDLQTSVIAFATSAARRRKLAEALAQGMLCFVDEMQYRGNCLHRRTTTRATATAHVSLSACYRRQCLPLGLVVLPVESDESDKVDASAVANEVAPKAMTASAPAGTSDLAAATSRSETASAAQANKQDSLLHPISHLINFAAEHFAFKQGERAKNTREMEPALLRALLSLFKVRGEHLNRADRLMLGRTVDRFVEGNPAEVSPLVVNLLLKKWPRHSSERQVVLLTQLESVFRFSDDPTVVSLLCPVVRCVARCVGHDNWHVSNAAMSFAEKLGDFAKAYIKEEPLVAVAVENLAQNLAKVSAAHWHAAVRIRANALADRAGRPGVGLPLLLLGGDLIPGLGFAFVVARRRLGVAFFLAGVAFFLAGVAFFLAGVAFLADAVFFSLLSALTISSSDMLSRFSVEILVDIVAAALSCCLSCAPTRRAAASPAAAAAAAAGNGCGTCCESANEASQLAVGRSRWLAGGSVADAERSRGRGHRENKSARMSRLYPGWGSGKASLEETFSVYSLESLGKADMEGGDKVILPQSTFRKVSRMKLPFPLTFEVTNPRLSKGGPTGGPKGGGSRKVIPREGNDKADEGKKKPRRPLVKQFCGVYEFSAPEDKAFVPNWMMRNLRLKQGQKIHFRSVLDGKIPRGTSCRLQPHTTAFLDLAASMDLRELLEHSFRNYSVLSTGQTLVVNFAGDNYRIDVVETKPEGAISLYGNLDLEVDFAPPLDQPDVGKLRPGSREMQEGEQAAQLSFGIAEISAADPAALPAGLANVVTTNQVTSPSQRQGKVESQAGQGQTSQKPQAHDWGKGQSLNGQVVVNSPTKATQQSSAPGVIQTENLTEGSAGPTIAQPTAAVTAS
ncbi:Ubiquitin fusion degradation protein 1 homolog, partial [Durusdinium trenchii]